MTFINYFFFAATQCPSTYNKFPLIPTWYKYLECVNDPITDNLTPTLDISNLNSLWGIGFAIIDMILRLAGIVVIGYIMYGGFQYITSTGNPDQTSKAKNTILNAFIGLLIIIIAIPLVSFIGGKL